ncbi:MAG: LysR family transcriptional regulator [Nannocystaceae bacterium]
MNLPSLENLRCFEAAALLLNFRAAAEAVALTPAALSQRIRQLEEQVGARLFERSTRSVRLTPQGHRLLPVARRCLAEAQACLRAVRGEEELPQVELTIGTRFELGMRWLLPEVRRFGREHPSVLLHLYFSSGPDLLLRLRSRALDCAVTSARLTDARLDAEPLHEERYVFVAQSELLRARPLALEADAGAHTLLDIDADLPLFRYFREASSSGPGPRFAAYRWLGLGAAVKECVLAGEGVAVLPLHMVEDELRGGTLTRIFPAIECRADHFRLVFRRDDPRRPIFERLAAALRTSPIA